MQGFRAASTHCCWRRKRTEAVLNYKFSTCQTYSSQCTTTDMKKRWWKYSYLKVEHPGIQKITTFISEEDAVNTWCALNFIFAFFTLFFFKIFFFAFSFLFFSCSTLSSEIPFTVNIPPSECANINSVSSTYTASTPEADLRGWSYTSPPTLSNYTPSPIVYILFTFLFLLTFRFLDHLNSPSNRFSVTGIRL